MLAGQGFEKVYNVKGGMMAWKGPVAEGPVELNMDLVRGDVTPGEIIRIAYGMEMSLGGFYRTMSKRVEQPEVVALLNNLASIEEKHKEYLLELRQAVDLGEVDRATFEAEVTASVMEGGFDSDEFIRNNEQFMQTVPGLLDISMMLETQALDLYLRFAQKTEGDRTKEILFKIGDEEKAHLAALGRLREEQT
jgi:rubrerythrin